LTSFAAVAAINTVFLSKRVITIVAITGYQTKVRWDREFPFPLHSIIQCPPEVRTVGVRIATF